MHIHHRCSQASHLCRNRSTQIFETLRDPPFSQCRSTKVNAKNVSCLSPRGPTSSFSSTSKPLKPAYQSTYQPNQTSDYQTTSDLQFHMNLRPNCIFSFFCKRKVVELSRPADFIPKFAEACALEIIFDCFPATFPGLNKRCIKLQSYGHHNKDITTRSTRREWLLSLCPAAATSTDSLLLLTNGPFLVAYFIQPLR